LKLIKDDNSLEAVAGNSIVSSFSNRASGNMSLFYGDTSEALENRKKFLNSLNINYKDLVCAKQAHGSNVKYVNEVDQGKGAFTYDTSIPDTDGLVTDIRNLPLAIFTADCLAIFLYDPQRPAVGLLHAGWRSSKEKIVCRAIELMRSKFKTNPKDLFAGFGPCIRDCCYAVGEEFNNHFQYGLIKRNNGFYLDLMGINKKQLLELGVKEKNFFDTGICTSCQNNDFFSYRKEGDSCGRMMSVMMLV